MNDPLPIDCASVEYLEGLLAAFLQNPQSAPPAWREYLARFAKQNGENSSAVGMAPSFDPRSMIRVRGKVYTQDTVSQRGDLEKSPNASVMIAAQRQDRVDQLIRAYRVRGHLAAELDPLDRPRPRPPELEIEYHGLSKAELPHTFSTTSFGGPAVQTLEEIVRRLQNTYCRRIGVQFMHIDELAVREWLQTRMEGSENHLPLHRDEQFRILTRLTDAAVFEQFIRKKYLGAKTFSLEGAESLIPLLHLAIEKAARQGVDEIVLGMAHRGRLNVLANIMGKSPLKIFWEFEDNQPELHTGGGDVKYHLGYSSDWPTSTGKEVHLSLCFNPSHLEFVNPVVLGRMRAKQDHFHDDAHRRGMALLIHGDAAFAGEGIVQETFNMSQLPAYHVGGALHVVVNNQIGFTTSPEEGRSCTYATDVARMLQIPVFHVNGEDPEAVAQVVTLALDFRQEFQRDVVIDMYCYRVLGHNESDEPSFTQPQMVRKIETRTSVRDHYLDRLMKLGEVTPEKAQHIEQRRREKLEEALSLAKESKTRLTVDSLQGHWMGFQGGPQPDHEPETAVDQQQLVEWLEGLNEVPDGFHLHPKLKKLRKYRQEMAQGRRPLDWSAGEALALASIAVEGGRVRMSGQDSVRGTFSQRHIGWYDHQDGHAYFPIRRLTKNQAPVEIYNSPLSEAGVLGFEYGYSLDCPRGLVLWEAQFGDFCNAAQVIIDQFITSAEDKWRRLSGVTLLLPHGFEGQGPEHSSARLERFLMMAAEDNIQIVQPTTPAQYFHILRRQALWSWKKPLVVFTPKSLLRHPQVISSLEELAGGRFQRVLKDELLKTDTPAQVLLCTGKVYYDLLEARQQNHDDNGSWSNTPILRLEQLYPFPHQQLMEALQNYPESTPITWVQEEPENMGARPFLRARYGDRLLDQFPLRYVCRPESASPATGSKASHKLEQKELISRAFGTDE